MVRRVEKGEIYYADLSPIKGSEQGGVRPVLVIQNNIGNRFSPTTIICVLTSRVNKKDVPTHVYLGKRFGLEKESVALLEQIRTVDKNRLQRKIGTVDDLYVMNQIDSAIQTSFGLSG